MWTTLLLVLAAHQQPVRKAHAKLYHARDAPFHPMIHNMGNVGVGGALHARLAEASTRLIDRLAYEGRDVRDEIARRYAGSSIPYRNRIAVDLACGIGTLTEHLVDRFDRVVGVDACDRMLDVATSRVPNASFVLANAVDAHRLDVDDADFLCVSCAFAFHEMPVTAHRRVLRSMRRLVGDRPGIVSVVDISPDYTPSPLMRVGEPFVDEYLATIDQTVRDFEGEGWPLRVTHLIPGHVTMWEFVKW